MTWRTILRLIMLGCVTLPLLAQQQTPPSAKRAPQVTTTSTVAPSAAEPTSPSTTQPDHNVQSDTGLTASPTLRVPEGMQRPTGETDLAHHYFEQMLSVILWSLATVVTLAVLLVGYGWYVNSRVYERDRAMLMDEVQRTARRHADTTRAELDKAFDDALARYRLSAEEQRQALATFQANIERTAQSTLAAHLDANTESIRRLEFDVAHLQAETWKNQRVFENALSCGVEMLDVANKLRSPYHRDIALTEIHRDLEKIVADDARIASATLSQLEVALMHAPPTEHQQLRRAIDAFIRRLAPA